MGAAYGLQFIDLGESLAQGGGSHNSPLSPNCERDSIEMVRKIERDNGLRWIIGQLQPPEFSIIGNLEENVRNR